MKRPKLIVSFLIISSFLFAFCDKRPFADIEIHGRIVHATTKEPLESTIDLWADGSPHEEGSHYFESTTSGVDGTFSIKSKASRHSDKYVLSIQVNSTNIGIHANRLFHVDKKQNLDAGEISVGP